jgi:hypothetical protein
MAVAFLCTVYLTGAMQGRQAVEDHQGVPGFRSRDRIVGFWHRVPEYLPGAMEAARLVFSGKDYHLTATESPMNSASSFARAFVTPAIRTPPRG